MASETLATNDSNYELKSTDLEHGSNPDEKQSNTPNADHVEVGRTESHVTGNLVYEDEEEEPELHFRTWIAVTSMVLLLSVQSLSLQGPPAVVSAEIFYAQFWRNLADQSFSKLSFIGDDLGGQAAQTWVPNALSLVQASLGPVISSASDTFQARKPILVASCVLAFIGSTIAPGSKDIYRVIGAQTLIGVGFAAVPITYCVPSEILPKRWRPSKLISRPSACDTDTDFFLTSGSSSFKHILLSHRHGRAFGGWGSYAKQCTHRMAQILCAVFNFVKLPVMLEC